jgi:hypothetical protein
VTITLHLPVELERELSQAAARLGMTLADYAVRILATNVSLVRGSTPMTGAELVADWQQEGIIGNRPDIDDPLVFARELREHTQNRIRE